MRRHDREELGHPVLLVGKIELPARPVSRAELKRMGMAADDTVPGEKYRKLLQQAQLYHTVLKRITRYESVEWIRKYSQRKYGVSGPEAIEMAYENVLAEAAQAVKGMRLPE